MWSRFLALAALGSVSTVLVVAPPASGQGRQQLEMYTIEGRADKIADAAGGVELAGTRQTRSGLRADAVLTASQRAKLAATGVGVALKRNKKGQTVTEQARAQAVGGFKVKSVEVV